MNQEYELSGKSGKIWLLGWLIGIPLAIIISIIYAYIDVYNPLVYLTAVAYVGYLYAIIIIQKMVVRFTRCRSKGASKIFGVIVGLFGVYANWVTFSYVLLQRYDAGMPFLELALSPGSVYSFASLIAVDGWYEMFGTSISGWLLWTIWIIEALGIFLAGMIGGSSVMHEEVYCEDCDRWAEDRDFDLRLSISDVDATQEAITNDIEKLLEFDVMGQMENPHLKVNLHHCSKCSNFSTIDIDLIALKEDDKGEISEDSTDFSPVFVLKKATFNAFLEKKKNGPTVTETVEDEN